MPHAVITALRSHGVTTDGHAHMQVSTSYVRTVLVRAVRTKMVVSKLADIIIDAN